MTIQLLSNEQWWRTIQKANESPVEGMKLEAGYWIAEFKNDRWYIEAPGRGVIGRRGCKLTTCLAQLYK